MVHIILYVVASIFLSTASEICQQFEFSWLKKAQKFQTDIEMMELNFKWYFKAARTAKMRFNLWMIWFQANEFISWLFIEWYDILFLFLIYFRRISIWICWQAMCVNNSSVFSCDVNWTHTHCKEFFIDCQIW